MKKNKEKTSLDKRHKDQILFFDEKGKKIEKLKINYESNIKKINKIKNMKFEDISQAQINQKALLLEQNKIIEKEINILNNNQDELLYFNDTIDYILPYYEQSNKQTDIKHVDIVDFFNNSSIVNKNDSGNNKAQLLDNYLKVVDNKQQRIAKNLKFKPKYCPNNLCESEMTLHLSDGYLICTECGFCEEVILDSDKPNYKDPVPDATAYSYKRIKVCAEKHSALVTWALTKEKQLCSHFLNNQMLVV